MKMPVGAPTVASRRIDFVGYVDRRRALISVNHYQSVTRTKMMDGCRGAIRQIRSHPKHPIPRPAIIVLGETVRSLDGRRGSGLRGDGFVKLG
jgi:hypothetical protein